MGRVDVSTGRFGEWMQVASGGKFFPLDPRPEEVEIDDIANGLALTCRYGGQGCITKFYSVAEHSMLMAEYALDLQGMWIKDRERLALAALMHDAAEAYAGDMVVAMKHSLTDFSQIENNIQWIILEKYNLWEDSLKWADVVKQLDHRIVVNEKAVLFHPTQEWATDSLKPLPGVNIMCYDSITAKNKWLELFFKLTEGTNVQPN